MTISWNKSAVFAGSKWTWMLLYFRRLLLWPGPWNCRWSQELPCHCQLFLAPSPHRVQWSAQCTAALFLWPTNVLGSGWCASWMEMQIENGNEVPCHCKSAVGVKKSLTKLPQKTAVIWHLSLTPIISTCFTPCLSIVEDERGTNLIPVWSQLRMSSGGISSMVTVAVTSTRVNNPTQLTVQGPVTLKFIYQHTNNKNNIASHLTTYIHHTMDIP